MVGPGDGRPEKVKRAAGIACALAMRGVAVVRRPDGNVVVASTPGSDARDIPGELIARFMLATSTIAALAAYDRCLLCGGWMGQHRHIPGFLRPLLGVGLTVHTACEAALAIERVRRAARVARGACFVCIPCDRARQARPVASRIVAVRPESRHGHDRADQR